MCRRAASRVLSFSLLMGSGLLCAGCFGVVTYPPHGATGKSFAGPGTGITQGEFAGPRFGFVVPTGDSGDTLDAAGHDSVLTGLGWQFELQYKDAETGDAGIFEFIPLLIGLDQSIKQLSLNGVVGMRFKNDFEFGVGINFTVFDEYDFWPEAAPMPAPSGESWDTKFGLVFGLGKTIRSGRMNIPLNFAIVRNSDGMNFSVLIGWNLGRTVAGQSAPAPPKPAGGSR